MRGKIYFTIIVMCMLVGCNNTSAQEMRLEKYIGSVILQNNTETKEVVEGSRLVSNDNLETFDNSNAYISLDLAKVLKLDESSQVEIVKVNNHLDVEVRKGSIYFSVSEPLEEDESLEFHTNNIVTGVRGTSGIITYVDKESQVVVLSGTVEVITIETKPQVMTARQGDVLTAVTLEDGSVQLELEKQENTPSYLFTDNFLYDLEDEVEEYIVPAWKVAYTQHLSEVESYYSNHSGLITNSLFYNASKYVEDVDLSNTTYWLHDMDLDGTPELFLAFHYVSTGFPESFFAVQPEQYEYCAKVYIFYLNDETPVSAAMGTEIKHETQYNLLNTSHYVWKYLSISPTGIGICQQTGFLESENRYTHTVNVTEFTQWTLTTKEGGALKNVNQISGDVNNALNGVPIDTSTWTHYTNLSGLDF